jgi:deoxycytidine triphosphate deaminase
VLLSDRDIALEVKAGRVKVEPFTDAMIQPSSVDVRLDRFFRVFENHKYSVIDPSIEQSDLTREVAVNDSFVSSNSHLPLSILTVPRSMVLGTKASVGQPQASLGSTSINQKRNRITSSHFALLVTE